MEENRAPFYWIVAALYYVPVLLGAILGWFGAVATLIFLFIPLLVAAFYQRYEFHALCSYLEKHHPGSWGSMAVRWLYWRGFDVERFVFSKELDDNPDLKAMKKNYRHLSLVLYCILAVLIACVLFFMRG